MKHLSAIIILLLSTVSYAQQRAQIGLYVPVQLPNKQVMPNMSTNGGIGISAGYSPFYGSPFYLELKSGWGSYSMTTLPQTYEFSDGTQTNTTVSYTSSMHHYMIGSKFMLNRDHRLIRIFATPGIGFVNMRSKVVVADPTDVDQCRPLERKITQHDAGIAYSGEIGMELNMSRIFNYASEDTPHKLILSATYLGSRRHFEYVNIRYMENEVHDMNSHPDPQDLNARFINVSTNNVHEHKVAEVYHTPISMWGFNIGYTINF